MAGMDSRRLETLRVVALAGTISSAARLLHLRLPDEAFGLWFGGARSR